jgi:DNA-binding NarL/FixJ family response regulator
VIAVALVEDDPVLRDALSAEIEAAPGLRLAGAASSYAEGRALILAGGFEVLLVDLGLPDGAGIDLIRQEARSGRDTDIIVITQFADQKKVLDSIRAGARGYLLKDPSGPGCVEAIAEIRRGGSPISPIIARQLMSELGKAGDDATAPASPLTEREHEVLAMLARGFSYRECADLLQISANTIGFHVKSIYRKLEVNSRAEALFEAMSQGIIRHQ